MKTQRKATLSIFTAFMTFMLINILLAPQEVQADDIEVYGTSNAGGAPVNVLFVFDLSLSMEDYPSGDGNGSAPVGQRRYDVLMEALTNVLDQNKTKSNLRVGVSWFNEWASGIMWPTTGIADDVNSIDPNIPAGTFQTYSFLPHLLKTSGSLRGKTRMVDALQEAAHYFRGDDVWKYHGAPKIWNVGQNKYKNGNNHAPNIHTYTATDTSFPPWHGTHAYTKKHQLKTKIQTAGSTTDRRFKNGYNPGGSVNEYKYIDVRNCNTRSGTSYRWVCPVSDTCTGSGENRRCGCPVAKVKQPYSYTYNYCDYDYWDPEWLGAKYNTPIENGCSPSYIILLSDGAPTKNTAESKAENMLGQQCANTTPTEGKCGPEIVEYLANNDQIASIPGSKVFTHTIGFNVDGVGKSFLQTLAAKGKGNFYTASTATDLEEAFEAILSSIAGDNESFTGIATSIRPESLSSDNRVFINMFKPGGTRSWPGNTKGYFIDERGLLSVDGTEAMETVDGTSRKFKDAAQSFWTTTADGAAVDQGGISGKLTAGGRSIYTSLGGNSTLTEITTSEATITPALLGVPDNATKNAVINWLDTAPMGDSLHAQPVMLSYPNRDVLFTMTNQGLLHGIDITSPTAYGDTSGGNELFAYIPEALLAQLKDHKANANATNHLYGLDGSMSYSHEDTNGNHKIDGSEKVTLFFGMRRGGKNYYALDVTNPAAPSLKWQITGGAGSFTDLGQSWSRPIVSTVKWGGSDKKVVIFAGGYDTAKDSHANRTPDTTGNAVYMVDANSGNLLWSAGGNNTHNLHLNQMKYSIPADITAIDTDRDRKADRLYFGDAGGQIWRIDLGNGTASGYRLADISKNGLPINNRRFYTAPSVALIRDNGSFHYAVAIGTGWRAHPLSVDTENRFYMVRDPNTNTGAPASTPSAAKETNFYDATANVIGQGSTTPTDPANLTEAERQAIEQEKQAAKALLDSKQGWFIKLEDSGEKNLTRSIIYNHKLAFTTFSPAPTNASTQLVCGGGGGQGRLYILGLKDGAPSFDLYSDNYPGNYLSKDDRNKTLPGAGIPSEPVLLFHPGGGGSLMVDKNPEHSFDDELFRVNWKEVE